MPKTVTTFKITHDITNCCQISALTPASVLSISLTRGNKLKDKYNSDIHMYG